MGVPKYCMIYTHIHSVYKETSSQGIRLSNPLPRAAKINLLNWKFRSNVRTLPRVEAVLRSSESVTNKASIA